MHTEQHRTRSYVFVPLQLLNEGALVEEGLQTLLSIVVAQVLKGCPTLALSQPGVLKAWCVHDEQRAQRVLAGFQSPGAQRENMYTYVHADISDS